MSTITTRSGKGSPLTHNEVDANFTNLNTDKYQSGDNVTFGTATVTTFTSTGIDDNATANVVTIAGGSSGSNSVIQTLNSGSNSGFYGSSTSFGFEIGDGGVGGKTIRINNNGTAIFSHNQVQDVINMSNAASVTVAGFTSTGIDDNATSTAITIDASENVGIGTAIPSKRLHIDTATNGGILLEDSANSITGIFYSSGSNSLALGSTSNHPVKFFTNNSERMRLDASGNLGIGNTNPSSYSFDNGPEVVIGDGTDNPHLSIVSPTTGTGYVAFADGTTGNEKYRGLIEYAHTTDHMGLRTGGTERMRITSDGNVWIGGTFAANSQLAVSKGTAAGLEVICERTVGGTVDTGAVRFLSYDRTGLAFTDLAYDAAEHIFGNGSTERMRIDASGNVGIGSASPTGFAGYTSLDINNATNGALIDLSQGDAMKGRLIATASTMAIETAASVPILFQPAGTERMRIDSSGRLLLGCTSSNGSYISSNHTQMNIQGQASGAIGSLMLRSQGTTNATAFELAASDGVAASYLWNGSNSHLVFGTNNTERMRIYASGNVGIGETSPGAKLQISQSSNSSDGLRVFSTGSGDVGQRAVLVSKFDNNTTTSQIFVQFAVNNNATTSGQINANGANAAAFGTWSDERLKENIVDLPPQLANICALRPVEFDYKTGGHQIGFIAQEMQEIYSDVVGADRDGMLGITGWSKTEARLVKAIQEQQAMIETLQAQVAELQGA